MSYFFVPDRKSFYYRSYVPKELRSLLNGRCDIWRSLFCIDKDQAKLRAADWDNRTQRVYMTLRKHGNRMTEDQREALVSEWLDAELEYAEDCRATAGRMSESQMEAQLDGLSIMQEEAAEDLSDNDYQRVESTAEELLKTVGLSIDHDSPDFGRLCRKLLEAKYKYTRIETRRWQGEEYTPLLHQVPINGHNVPAAPLPTAPPVAVKASATGPLFMEALDGYLRESPRTDRSTRALKAELRRFLVAIGGDRPVSSITKPDCLKYKDSMLKEDERGLHLATVSDRLTTLASIFKWCESQGYIPVLLLCLFSVCRREEAAQLHMTDIREEDGIPYLLITEEDGTDKSVKTNTTRRLPVHESLIHLGFMEYVKQVRSEGHTRLFYQVSKGRSTYADAAGKMFSRLVRGLGMTDEGLVLHSLRHLGSTKLAEAGCPPDIARILTGHSGTDVHDKVYVHRENVKLSVLRDGLNRLRYDAVLEILSIT